MIPSSEEPFIHRHFEAASVYSSNPQVLLVTALPYNPPLTMSNTHIHTNQLIKQEIHLAYKKKHKKQKGRSLIFIQRVFGFFYVKICRVVFYLQILQLERQLWSSKSLNIKHSVPLISIDFFIPHQRSGQPWVVLVNHPNDTCAGDVSLSSDALALQSLFSFVKEFILCVLKLSQKR